MNVDSHTKTARVISRHAYTVEASTGDENIVALADIDMGKKSSHADDLMAMDPAQSAMTRMRSQLLSLLHLLSANAKATLAKSTAKKRRPRAAVARGSISSN